MTKLINPLLISIGRIGIRLKCKRTYSSVSQTGRYRVKFYDTSASVLDYKDQDKLVLKLRTQHNWSFITCRYIDNAEGVTSLVIQARAPYKSHRK